MTKPIRFITLLLLTPFLIFAQTERLTQADVDLQQSFIEGTRLLILEKYEEAITQFETVLARDKTNAAAAYELARAYKMIDEGEKALKFAKN